MSLTQDRFSHRVGMLFLAGLIGLLSSDRLSASDWPQFLGPSRNGTTTQSISTPWPAEGPKRLWKLPLGTGFSGPVVSQGQVLILDRSQDQERLQALDLRTGKVVWTQQQPTAYVDRFGFDNGPRATPAATPHQVVTFGAEGRLTCVQRSDGKLLWTVDAGRQLAADRGFFGAACSPLILGDRIFLNLGNTEGGGVAAFSLQTGKLLWKATDHEAGYASPTPSSWKNASGESEVLFFTREGLVIAQPDGKIRKQHPWRSRQSASVNAASALVNGNEIFLTSSYDTGAVLLRWKGEALETVWSNDESLSAHYATPVESSGFIYGFHGRQESGPEFRCIEWATGRVRWKVERLGAGTVALAKNRLVLLLESGEILVAEAQPESFQVVSRSQILGRGTRAPFALAQGSLVARDTRQLICLEVGPTGSF